MVSGELTATVDFAADRRLLSAVWKQTTATADTTWSSLQCLCWPTVNHASQGFYTSQTCVGGYSSHHSIHQVPRRNDYKQSHTSESAPCGFLKRAALLLRGRRYIFTSCNRNAEQVREHDNYFQKDKRYARILSVEGFNALVSLARPRGHAARDACMQRFCREIQN
jgi:hypothetical protein